MVHKSTVLQSGGGGGVASLNGETGAISLTSSGATITITPSDSTINLEATSGGLTAIPAYSVLANPTSSSAVPTGVQQLLLGTLSYADTGILESLSSSNATYNQEIIQNTNSGSTASTNYIVSNDQGTATTNFGEFGMNSSTFAGSGSFNLPGAVYLDSTTADLVIGTTTANEVHFVTNGATTDAGSINSSGIWTINSLTATNTITGSISGNAATATIAPAGTLSGSTLNSGVTASSLTSLGAQSAALNMNSHLINNVTDPASPQDAATKNYVDSVAQGLSTKASAVVATTAALPTNIYNNGASGVGATLTAVAVGVLTIDGVAVATGNRIVIKNEVTAANNGLYVCTVAGAAGAAYVLTRTTDANTSAELDGAFVFIESGTAYASTGWVIANSSVITIGTTAITWTQFSGTGSASIGGVVAGATQGSVLFAGASSVLAQDNANFYWNDATFSLGIGTASPNSTCCIDMQSTTQGVGIPIMTSAQRNAMTLTRKGVIVYDTDANTPFIVGLYTSWDALCIQYTAASYFTQGSIYFGEQLQYGSNIVTLQSPATLAASYTVTLPSKNGTLACLSDIAGGGITRSVNTVSSNTTVGGIAGTDYVYLCSGTMNLNLSGGSGTTNVYTAKNIGGGITTLIGVVDGATNPTISALQSLDLIWNGANWSII